MKNFEIEFSKYKGILSPNSFEPITKKWLGDDHYHLFSTRASNNRALCIWERDDLSYRIVSPYKISYKQAFPHEELKTRAKHIEETISPLEKLDEILNVSKSIFGSKFDYLFHRIGQLITLFEDEGEGRPSAPSLKSMLLFLASLGDIKKPTITINEEGIFQSSWKKSNDFLASLRFKDDNYLDYVLFLPSQNNKAPVILNGSMSSLDFFDFIKRLAIKEIII